MSEATAKDLRVAPIKAADANALVQRVHYSGKVVPNSQLHLGVFLGGRLEGVMQFGPSMDKRKTLGLVRGTEWNGFLELNRMAFSERLPRNSESRAISIAMRIIRKAYPHIEWIISFADGTQCGDGTIYRASGFLLTGIKENKTILKMPGGSVVADKTLNNSNYILKGQSAGYWKKNGATPLEGFQLRYVYFLNPSARDRLTVPVLPFSAIEKAGASMYRGKRNGILDAAAATALDATALASVSSEAVESPSTVGGAAPTRTLNDSPARVL
jgi:hypothetical protein